MALRFLQRLELGCDKTSDGQDAWPRVQTIASNLWVLRYPLSVMGAQLGRTVTILRLSSDDLIIHSTAPFTAAEVSRIRGLGRPGWLVDATLFHDTFVSEARRAFPDVPLVAPEGFSCAAIPLSQPPLAWMGEVEVLPVDGIPRLREYVFFHPASRTLIVADLVFNFGPRSTGWTRLLFRWAGGIKQYPGVSRLYRSCITDRAAFHASLQRILQCDFDRMIVGHGDVIDLAAKAKLQAAIAAIRP